MTTTLDKKFWPVFAFLLLICTYYFKFVQFFFGVFVAIINIMKAFQVKPSTGKKNSGRKLSFVPFFWVCTISCKRVECARGKEFKLLKNFYVVYNTFSIEFCTFLHVCCARVCVCSSGTTLFNLITFLSSNGDENYVTKSKSVFIVLSFFWLSPSVSFSYNFYELLRIAFLWKCNKNRKCFIFQL